MTPIECPARTRRSSFVQSSEFRRAPEGGIPNLKHSYPSRGPAALRANCEDESGLEKRSQHRSLCFRSCDHPELFRAWRHSGYGVRLLAVDLLYRDRNRRRVPGGLAVRNPITGLRIANQLV